MCKRDQEARARELMMAMLERLASQSEARANCLGDTIQLAKAMTEVYTALMEN